MVSKIIEISPIDTSLQEEYERETLRMLIACNDAEKQNEMLLHVSSEMFRNRIYQGLCKAIEKLKQNKSNVVDVTALVEANKKESIKQLLIDLQEEYITSANFQFYAQKLQTAYIKQLLKDCDSLEGFKAIEAIKRKYAFESDVIQLSSDSDALIMEYYNKWGTAIQTYYPSIDKALGTLQGGDLLILAGATGMGKTCMMLNLIRNMALNGKKVLM